MNTEQQRRIGVNCFPGDDVRKATDALPLGWYKDYSFLGTPIATSDAAVDYVPILMYQGKRDTPAARVLARLAWIAGGLPRLPGQTLRDALDALSLARLERRLGRDAGRGPPGTLFQLGIEPGYASNADDRSPAQVAADARRVKAMLDRLGRGYRLALGGIATQETDWARKAYRGVYGMAFFENVLDAAAEVAFDALVVHPYPAAPSQPSAFADCCVQVLEFRKVMARRGLRATDLLVGEIGVPFAGVTESQAVAFAAQIVEFLLTATDAETGNPRDGNRLVQRFCWYNLTPPTFRVPGVTDNPGLDHAVSALMSPAGELTAVGNAFRDAIGRCRGVLT